MPQPGADWDKTTYIGNQLIELRPGLSWPIQALCRDHRVNDRGVGVGWGAFVLLVAHIPHIC